MLKIRFFSPATWRPGVRRGVRLLFVIGCCLNYERLFAAQLFDCTSDSIVDKDFGVLEPNQKIEQNIFSDCRVLLATTRAAYLTHTQYGSKGRPFIVRMNGKTVPADDAWASKDVCIPSDCAQGFVREQYSATFMSTITGVASDIPGSYLIRVDVLAHAPEVGFAGVVGSLMARYVIAEPACSLSSAANLSLSFGTLNSDEFGSAQRVADISLNCAGTTNVTAQLVPAQKIISGNAGLSATTLDGLHMVTTWADNDTAVDFSVPRSLPMTKGVNLISLGFRPQLESGASPAGAFSGQYTLNLDYR